MPTNPTNPEGASGAGDKDDVELSKDAQAADAESDEQSGGKTQKKGRRDGGAPNRNGKSKQQRAKDSFEPVSIEIAAQDYAVDERELWWYGLTDDCPIDHCGVAGVTFSIRTHRVVERRGHYGHDPQSGAISKLSDAHVSLILEKIKRVGVEVLEVDGELHSARKCRLAAGAIPLAKYAFMRRIREGERIGVGAPLPPPMLANPQDHVGQPATATA